MSDGRCQLCCNAPVKLLMFLFAIGNLTLAVLSILFTSLGDNLERLIVTGVMIFAEVLVIIDLFLEIALLLLPVMILLILTIVGAVVFLILQIIKIANEEADLGWAIPLMITEGITLVFSVLHLLVAFRTFQFFRAKQGGPKSPPCGV